MFNWLVVTWIVFQNNFITPLMWEQLLCKITLLIGVVETRPKYSLKKVNVYKSKHNKFLNIWIV